MAWPHESVGDGSRASRKATTRLQASFVDELQRKTLCWLLTSAGLGSRPAGIGHPR